jgi:hypothetical protein
MDVAIYDNPDCGTRRNSDHTCVNGLIIAVMPGGSCPASDFRRSGLMLFRR